MARKIFVSYKHNDSAVRPFVDVFGRNVHTTARNYVDQIMSIIGDEHIYKGEGNEDLSEFKDETIETRLKNRIFDRSLTIVLISKNMMDAYKQEEDQWIPWEISYSLRAKSRDGRYSNPNGMIAVVLPDENNSHDYFVESSGCPNCNSISWKHASLFKILGKNMFNRKSPNILNCEGGVCEGNIHYGHDHSYIYPVTWEEFVRNSNNLIEHAISIRENFHEYNISRNFS